MREKERPEGELPTPLSSGADFTHELYISVIGLKITFCQESVANVIRVLRFSAAPSNYFLRCAGKLFYGRFWKGTAGFECLSA